MKRVVTREDRLKPLLSTIAADLARRGRRLNDREKSSISDAITHALDPDSSAKSSKRSKPRR